MSGKVYIWMLESVLIYNQSLLHQLHIDGICFLREDLFELALFGLSVIFCQR